MSVVPLPHKEAVSDDIQECLDKSIAELLREREQTIVPIVFAWRGDKNSCLIINGLRESGEVISHSTTKLSMLTLIARGKPSDLVSLYDELSQQVQSMLNYFIMFRSCDQVSNYLFRLTQAAIRSMFEHLKALIDLVDQLIYKPVTKKTDARQLEADDALVRNATGMIWSVQEDLRGLPGNNRNAFRRSVLVQVTSVRDTIREFEEYIEEAVEAQKSGVVIVDDPDDELQSVPYTAEEVQVVSSCVDKMKLTEKCMKLGLLLITAINDYLEPVLREASEVPLAGASSSSLPPQPGSPTRESSGISDVSLQDLQLSEAKDRANAPGADAVKEMRALTSSMSELCSHLTHGCTDMGLELFVPFDMDKVNAKLAEQTEHIRALYVDHFLRMDTLFMAELRRCMEVGEDGQKTETCSAAVVDKYLKIKGDILSEIGVHVNTA